MIFVVGILLIDTFINLLIAAVKPPLENITFARDKDGNVNPDKEGTINTILNMGVWKYFEIFAIGLTLCYFIIDINKKWAFEGNSMTLKSMFLPFMKLMVFVVCIYFLPDLFGALLGFNDSMMLALNKLGEPTKNMGNISIGQQLASSTNLWGRMLLLLFGTVGLAVGIVVKLVWVYKGLLYRVEFVTRVLFAPVACADVYSGQNSALFKYIKGTVALLLYGACLVIIPQVTMMIALSDLAGATNWQSMIKGGGNIIETLLSCIEIVIAPIASIGLVGTAKSMMREAIGA